MITRSELANGIRFAGARAAAALEHVKDFDRQLAHEWTTADAFRHVATTAGALETYYPALGSDALNQMGVAAMAAANEETNSSVADRSRDELKQMILEGSEASARFVERCSDQSLAEVITLGGYEMSRAEVVAQIWIHHQIAHAYEATVRWPL